MDFGWPTDKGSFENAQSQLPAFAAKTLAAINVSPAFFSDVDGGSVNAAREIRQALEVLGKKDVIVRPVHESLVGRFPANFGGVKRIQLLRLISDWLHDQLDDFPLKEAQHQLAVMRIVRVTIRWTKLEDDLYGFMEILLEGVISSAYAVRAITTMCLSAHSYLQQVSLPELFHYHEEGLGVRLAGKFLRNPDPVNLGIVSSCIREFQFENVENFMFSMIPYVLQPLVCDGSPASLDALRFVAGIVNKSVGDMLCVFFDLLLPVMIVRVTDEAVLQQGVHAIEKLTGKPLSRLIMNDCNRIHNELLLYLDIKPEAVLKGLKFIAAAQGLPGELLTDGDVANYLQPRFLGFVFYADSKLIDPTVPTKVKRRILKSFSKLIEFMGSRHISSVRTKLLAILKFVVQTFPAELQPTCCEAWRAFIHTLDMPSLKSILSQVAVILLPLVKTNPGFVVPIFEYLIVEKRKFLHDHFQELFFIPDMKILHNVNVVLAGYNTRTDVAQHFSHYLMDQLQFVDIMDTTNKVTHNLSLATDDRRLRVPQMEVRQYALRKLKMMVRSHQTPLYNMIVAPEQLKSARTGAGQRDISRLMATLMNCSREAVSPQERQRFGEVLGAIGAVDPDRVEVQAANDAAPARWLVFPGVRQQEFAVNFLKELVKGYMTAEKTTTQDACGVVIQEALKFYGLRDDKKPHELLLQNAIWGQLSRDYQEVLTPFLTSRYRFFLPASAPADNAPDTESPVVSVDSQVPFGSASVATYAEWIQDWTVRMINRITTKTTTSDFLQQCIHLVQYDQNRCVMLLPYVVLYLLVHCEAQQKERLFAEMVGVLRCHDQPAEMSSDFRQPAIQTILSLLDFLREWYALSESVKMVRDEQLLIAPLDAENQHCIQLIYLVEVFVGEFTDDLLARASFNCQTYPKALLHYEKHLWQEDRTWTRWRDDKKAINFMQQVYVALEERDGVAGLNNVRVAEPSVEDKIVLHLSTGNIQEALLCYEQMAQMSQNCLLPDQQSSIMRGLMDLDEPSKTMLYCNGIIAEKPEWLDELNAYRIEAAWKLGHWDALDGFLSVERDPLLPTQWNTGVGRLLLDAKNQNSDGFRNTMANLQAHLMGPVCAANMDKGAYHRSYDNIVQLHTLYELEEGALTWFKIQPDEEFRYEAKPVEQLLAEWNLRLSLAQPSYHNIQKILTVRRIVLQATGDDTLRPQIGQCWLKSAKMARKANHLQTAYSFLLKSEAYEPLDLPREQAKYLWARGEPDKAIAYLEKATQDRRWLAGVQRLPIFAKTKLLLARYLDQSKSLAVAEMSAKFAEVVEIAPQLEKSHFYLGQYHDKIFEEPRKDCKDVERQDRQDKERLMTAWGEHTAVIIEQFVEALKFGCRFIHQTLPRLLTLWLDFGAELTDKFPITKRTKDKSMNAGLVRIFTRIQDLMKSALGSIPSYVFLTAFPQLISRICIANEDVFVVLAEIIAKTVQSFPQQTMWHLLPVNQSKKQARTRRFTRIMEKVQAGQDEHRLKFLTNMNVFCKECVVFCNIKPDVKQTFTHHIADFGELRTLRRLMDKTDWMHPVLPFREFMTPVLPDRGCSPTHQPFAQSLPTISHFAEKFTVLASLQRPKRVGVVDSMGNTHSLLLKPKDDLRKDSRFMELVEMVNKFLREDSEARRRQLKIRTYSVVPLSEDCGIIEWVPNVSTMRGILLETYRRENREVLNRDALKALMGSKDCSLEVKMKLFEDLLRQHPSVLHLWLERAFSDPTAWLTGRLAYSRTCAVMSMVGYVMGLGDRHLENILLDTTTAEVFHVDYSCLFNKGETLDWIERVPFRLTHNVVDGMGPLGVEGFYRTACELTLKVIRHEKNAMMSVLKPFLHDPLVEWQSKSGFPSASRPSDSGESHNDEAAIHFRRIEGRIQGQTGKPGDESSACSLPLSVQGQVNYVIREATSKTNLSQMYVGWGPFM